VGGTMIAHATACEFAGKRFVWIRWCKQRLRAVAKVRPQFSKSQRNFLENKEWIYYIILGRNGHILGFEPNELMVAQIVKRRASSRAPFDRAFVHLLVSLVDATVTIEQPFLLKGLIASRDVTDVRTSLDMSQEMFEEVGLSFESSSKARRVTAHALSNHPSKTCVANRGGQAVRD
jgi:hypothetical protein